jgi:exopolyphosphatase/guanosine-5'-triphosphate,3'-diphosphate pyrophosphatase
MPLGVVDVGSNTVRLLIKSRGRSIRTEREMLRLGADVELYGRISEAKLEETRSVVAQFAEIARDEGVEQLEILITSPGRQAANGRELADVLGAAADCPVQVLSALEEGRLAFLGAVEAAAPPARRSVAVVDVGGGSAQVVVGSRRTGPQWLRSIDLGSQRLTSRLLSADPPGAAALERARVEVETYLADLDPPAPRLALAVGGSARAVKRIVGPRLGPDELQEALALLAETPTDEVGARFDIGDERARTLAAGVVILAGLQARLDTPLRVVRSGLRDGALIDLAARRAVA